MRSASRLLLSGVLLLATVANACAATGSLTTFLEAHGFAHTELRRRVGNQLFIRASINQRPAALIIDTSATMTVVHRDSARTFGLAANESGGSVGGIFGEVVRSYGAVNLSSLRVGNQTLTNVRAVVTDQSARVDPPEFMPISKMKWNAKRKQLKHYLTIDPVDGLLGLDVLRRCGAVLDCGRQLLYTGGNSSSAAALAEYLADRGFGRIPMQLSRKGQLEVTASINGHSTRLIVDTGSSFTLLRRDVAARDGVFSAPLRFAYDLGGNRLEELNGGTVNELRIGNFPLEKVQVNVANIVTPGDAGVLGIDLLSMNFAVIDFGTSTLYLRRAHRR